MDGHDRGVLAPQQPGEIRLPRGIGDAMPGQVQARHLARREQHERAAAAQPAHRLTHACNVAGSRARAAKGVDRDVERPHLGDRIEQEVAEELEEFTDDMAERAVELAGQALGVSLLLIVEDADPRRVQVPAVSQADHDAIRAVHNGKNRRCGTDPEGEC